MGEGGRALHDAVVACLGPLVRRHIAAASEVAVKDGDLRDLVTSTDLALQDALSTALDELTPGIAVLGEEGFSPEAQTGARWWLVDPLDGTVNFVAGVPFCASSVVLMGPTGPEIAVTYDIAQDRVFSAWSGGGAWVDGTAMVRRDHAAKLGVLSSGLLHDLAQHSPQTLAALLDRVKLRNLGSQALHLCYAATGTFAWVASREAKGWDDLGGALIAREAGVAYGSYDPAPRTIDADQHSLCAPTEQFGTLAQELAHSQPAPRQRTAP